ncbi:peritrophin-44 isoform X2 [Drosophila novamexicana]|nr:peritrophin-44 isoform X2 [Drosophila novamexicana]
MDDMCAQWSGTGYVGNPTDCTSWGYCKNQQLVATGTCTKGEVYEPQSQSCQYASTTPCTTSAKETCSALKTAGFVAEPSDCTKYTYCFGNGKSETQTCPTGQMYAANNNSCVWGPTCPQDTLCRFMPNNIFVGDPTNCNQYLQCINGYGVSGTCPTGFPYYNAVNNVCQKTNTCTGNNNGGVTTSTPPVTNIACTDAKPFTKDGATCYGYLYCADGAEESVWGSCPFGLEFDEDAQACISPAATVCAFDRCQNTNLTYAAVAGSDCRKYTYCPANTVGTCPTDFQYFDEVIGKCVGTQPTQAICTEPLPTSTD